MLAYLCLDPGTPVFLLLEPPILSKDWGQESSIWALNWVSPPAPITTHIQQLSLNTHTPDQALGHRDGGDWHKRWERRRVEQAHSLHRAQRAVSTDWHCLSWPFSCSPQHSKDRIPSSQPYLKTHNLPDYSFLNVSILGNIRNMAAPSTGVFF